MPTAAPVLHYVLHENFTPAHRAQLSRSHKKVEQILGVTPSLQAVPPPVPSTTVTPKGHGRSVSCTPSTRTKAQARERGRLRNLFGIEIAPTTEEDEAILHRVSTDSSTSSTDSSSSTESLADRGGRRYVRHRPPPLKISHSNFGKQDGGKVKEISIVVDKIVEVDSPLSPTFKVELNRARSRDSILEEREWNKIIQNVDNLPIDHKEKARKLNRLGKVFGVMPPLEMVFPPTPSSRSRFDPKRYTLDLPPALVRGTLTDDINERRAPYVDVRVEDSTYDDQAKVMRVDWETINDEAGRQKVMEALRLLRN